MRLIIHAFIFVSFLVATTLISSSESRKIPKSQDDFNWNQIFGPPTPPPPTPSWKVTTTMTNTTTTTTTTTTTASTFEDKNSNESLENDDDQPKSLMSTSTVVIVVVCLLLMLVIGCLVLWCFCRRRSDDQVSSIRVENVFGFAYVD